MENAYDDTRFADMSRSQLFYRYLFRIKIKEEMYGDECQASICFYAPFRLRRVPCICNILQIEFYQQTLSVVHLVVFLCRAASRMEN
ncbi:hypothetical protein DKX38_009839 [Salix brachista]|uniref:Uncharacterized protein n=1 Tax=Salix brachista TaxID=2182728 RepID=A0A5N5MBS1_9ROSI|nr:hypothetical protein DKX38_009839 [Salix brachista]